MENNYSGGVNPKRLTTANCALAESLNENMCNNSFSDLDKGTAFSKHSTASSNFPLKQ